MVRGIVLQGNRRVALVNDQNLAEGEVSFIQVQGGRRLRVKCLAVGPASVRVEVDGRELELSLRSAPADSEHLPPPGSGTGASEPL